MTISECSRYYWVTIDHDQGEPSREKVAAYDANDAAAQFRIANPGLTVVSVEPFVDPGTIEPEYVGRGMIARNLMGVHPQTAGEHLADLEADWGLLSFGSGGGTKWRLDDVRKAITRRAKGS